MAKIIDIDYRNGSNLERISSLLPTLVNAPKMVKTPKGQAFDFVKASSQTVYYPTTSGIITTNDFAIEIWGKIKPGSTGTTWLLRKGGAGGALPGYSVYVNQATGIITCDIQDASGATAIVAVSGGYNYFHFICNYDRDGSATLYYNNVLERTTAISTRSGTLSSAAAVTVGASSTLGGDPLDGQILKAVVHDRLLTEQERNTSYSDFLNSQPIGKPKRGFLVNKPNDLSSQKGTGPTQGLVAAYNMKPVGTTVTDISGNGYNGTITQGVTTTQNGIMMRQGQAITTTSMPLENDFSIAFRVKWLTTGSTSNFLRQNGSANSNIWIYRSSLGAIVLDQNAGGSNGTPNGSAGPIGSEQTWVLTFNDATNTVTWYRDGVSLGTGSGTYNPSGSRTAAVTIGNLSATETNYIFKEELQDLRFYNRILTAQEIKDYHNSFAKQPYLVEDFSDLPADGNAVVPRDWTKTSGSFKGGEIIIKDSQIITGFSLSGITGMTATGYTHAYVGGSGEKNIAAYDSTLAAFNGQGGSNYTATFDVTINSGTFPNTTFSVSVGGRAQNITAGSNTFNIIGVNGTNGFYITVTSSVDVNYTISNFKLVQSQALPTLTKGTKYLECVTAGIIAIPSNQLAGTWEWDWYKGADANTSKFHFVAPNFAGDGLSSMTFYVDNSENLLLRVSNSTIASTATSYFQNFTWYRVRVTRTTAGFWTMLIKGGAFTPTAGYDGWTLISTTGGTGTNPIINTVISSSIYLLFDIDAGDRFTNLKLTNGVIV